MTTLTYNGLTLIASNGYVVNTARGFNGLESIRISEANVTGRNGGNIYARKLGMRTIYLRGTVSGSTVDEFFTRKNALIEAFSYDSDSLFSATLWNGETYNINAKCVQEPEITYDMTTHTRAEFEVMIRCETPFWRSTTTNTLTLTLAQVVGFDIPFDIPFDITILTTGNTGSITNDGLGGSAYPKITIYGATNLSNPTVTNLTNGSFVQITNGIPENHYVVIEQKTNGISVLYDGVTDWYQFFLGSLQPLDSGINSFSYTSDTYILGGTADIEFTSVYKAL